MIAHDNIVVEPDDHFVLFLVDKTTIRDVEALFQSASELLLAHANRRHTQDFGNVARLFSATLVPPSIVSIIYQDGLLITFGQAGITIFIVGAVLMTIFKQFANELRTKDGFLVTALCYFALGAFSALSTRTQPCARHELG